MKKKLIDLLGNQNVCDDEETLREHGADKWLASHAPEVVVFAETTEDICRLLKFAHEEKISVTTRGAGTGYVGGAVPVQGGIVLSTVGMDKIKEIDPLDGVAVVQPGVITADLQEAAKKLGYFYPPDPASIKECSIGGNVATNAGGPRCLKYGVTRHYVLGLEVVLSHGEVLRTGNRCHKNKTGFDLVGLFVGSEGLLGVITEITLRLIPHPPAKAALSVWFTELQEAAGAVETILGNGFLPSALEITDSFTLNAARHYHGATALPQGDAHLLLEIDGQEEAVATELLLLKKLLQGLHPLTLEEARGEKECETLWELRRSFSYSLRATGLKKFNHDVVVPRRRLVDLIHFCERLQKETQIPIACFGHAGDGNIHVNVMVEESPSMHEKIDPVIDKIFTQVLEWGGAVTGEHGVGLARKPWLSQALTPTAIDVHRKLKQTLDPKGILNPGKFI